MFCSTMCRGFAFFQSRVALQSADVVFRKYLCVRRGVPRGARAPQNLEQQKKKPSAFSTSAQSKFASIVLDSVLGQVIIY